MIQTKALDTTHCDREPIHIPGSIQPHGVLLVFDESDHILLQGSTNTDAHLGRPLDALLGKSMEQLLGETGSAIAEKASAESLAEPLQIDGREFEATFHRVDQLVVVELEPQSTLAPLRLGFHNELRAALSDIRSSITVRSLAEDLARHVRAMAGFDRVMVYRFLEDDSGVVIAEDRREDLAPYLGLHYPASDIPKQARALYVKNWLRTIYNVDYQSVPVQPTHNPRTGKALDMSRCVLRSVSPIHVQYLKNMEVGASMSVSLVEGERLWGLIACHHETAWYGGADVRGACELLGQVASLQIASLEAKEERAYRVRAQALQARLLDAVTQGNSVGSLADEASDLLDLVNATGAAVLTQGQIRLIGATPSPEVVASIVTTLEGKTWPNAFDTDSLGELHDGAEAFAAVASGVLAVCHAHRANGYVLWFRPEIVQTVTWAGNPEKATTSGDNTLRPRSSFAAWQQTVRGKSRPWRKAEIQAALDLRIAIMEHEIGVLNQELESRVRERTEALQQAVDDLNGFTYTVSHDLRTPLRGMIGNSRILVEEHGTNLGRPVREGLMRIETAALKMSALVESLLQFARVGRQAMRVEGVDFSAAVAETVASLNAAGWNCSDAEIEVEPGLHAQADRELLAIVLNTLLDNACKYRRPGHPAKVKVGRAMGGEFYVQDDGIGFDMKYLPKLFQPFERLHRDADYPGTGIGLANAKRIVERHGGTMWAEGVPGKGATFYFTLPG